VYPRDCAIVQVAISKVRKIILPPRFVAGPITWHRLLGELSLAQPTPVFVILAGLPRAACQ
jgi:hypothetical protein